MKLKCQPDDFYVEEVINLSLTKTGLYSVYKLEKQHWDTFDLLDYLSRKYHFKNIGRAGIKDRYSHSIQYLSIKGEKQKEIEEKNFKLTFIGKSNEPITLNNLINNKFTIVVRDLNQKEMQYIQNNIQNVIKLGFCNYYDEQRMGSARAKQGFIAQKLMLKHYNGALKLYLATPSSFDDSRTRKLKSYLSENWGDWQASLDISQNFGQYRYPLLYLVKNPKDFKGAVKTIRRDLLEMFINAYQAYLWNETLKKLLEIKKVDYFLRKYRFGDLYFYNNLSDEDFNYFKKISIPAASPKDTFKDSQVKSAMEQVLITENVALKDFKIYLDIKGLFFKPYERNAIVIPEDLKIDELTDDDLYPKKYKLSLSFALPKGSYATILLKRVTSL